MIDHDSRLLAASRPTSAAVEAAARKAAAAAPARPRKGASAGKGPKGLAAPKGLGGSGSGGGSSGGGEAGAAGCVASAAAVRAGHAADHAQAAQSSAMRPLCQGLMHMLVGLSAAGVQAPPELPFNSAAERYEQRFGSFHILTRPEPLAYSQFEAATATAGAEPGSVLAAAIAALGKVRTKCDIGRMPHPCRTHGLGAWDASESYPPPRPSRGAASNQTNQARMCMQPCLRQGRSIALHSRCLPPARSHQRLFAPPLTTGIPAVQGAGDCASGSAHFGRSRARVCGPGAHRTAEPPGMHGCRARTGQRRTAGALF